MSLFLFYSISLKTQPTSSHAFQLQPVYTLGLCQIRLGEQSQDTSPRAVHSQWWRQPMRRTPLHRHGARRNNTGHERPITDVRTTTSSFRDFSISLCMNYLYDGMQAIFYGTLWRSALLPSYGTRLQLPVHFPP